MTVSAPVSHSSSPTDDRPRCECHGEPMWSHWDQGNGRSYWRCAVKNRERMHERYWRDPIGHNRRKEEGARRGRLARMEQQLKEML